MARVPASHYTHQQPHPGNISPGSYFRRIRPALWLGTSELPDAVKLSARFKLYTPLNYLC